MSHRPLKHSEVSWILQAIIEGTLPSADVTKLPNGGEGIQPASPLTPKPGTSPAKGPAEPKL